MTSSFLEIIFKFVKFKGSSKNNEMLETFAQFTYTTLQAYSTNLPDTFARTVPYLISQNWLFHYQFKEGIEKSFGVLVRRAV